MQRILENGRQTPPPILPGGGAAELWQPILLFLDREFQDHRVGC